MTAIHYRDQNALKTLVSEQFGEWSNSIVIEQSLINQFADLSGDNNWLHVDEQRCKQESPFGCTIAQGFLILSLISKMNTGIDITERVTGYSHMMNYGSDKLRFPAAVTVNSEIHARSRINAVQVSDKKTKVVMETHVHSIGMEKPALIYELMFVFL